MGRGTKEKTRLPTRRGKGGETAIPERNATHSTSEKKSKGEMTGEKGVKKKTKDAVARGEKKSPHP